MDAATVCIKRDLLKNRLMNSRLNKFLLAIIHTAELLLELRYNNSIASFNQEPVEDTILLMTTPDNLEHEIQKRMADPYFQQIVFNNLMEVFILPNIKRRQEVGELPDPLPLIAAQVLLYPDDRPIEIRVNQEVRGTAEMVLKPGVEVGLGDPVQPHHLEAVSNFKLDDNDDPDCAYIVLLWLHEKWVANFNFLYNGGLSQKHLLAARQFYEVAQFALKEKYLPVFVDTLFSASELAVKGLMLRYRPDLRGKKGHGKVHEVFNIFARDGNVKSEQRDMFNKLSRMRGNARYLQTDVELEETEASQMLEIVSAMIEELEKIN
jgi:uncharacterized protein (UPF0332 family)